MRELSGRLEGSIAELKPASRTIDPTNKNPRAAPAARGFFWGKNKTPQARAYGVLSNKSLTMTYFHRRPSTIIGAKAFHCPVRD
ncbi:hypothetical protein ACFWXM_13915, partial [Achromobacter xylosoxidans]|uniref:hypothetical protein n=2 Tax=Alcaligenes xylosoxydans xylosoxydans TaxID=85698 RepID=UPI0037617454